jgi:hypothetical protein
MCCVTANVVNHHFFDIDFQTFFCKPRFDQQNNPSVAGSELFDDDRPFEAMLAGPGTQARPSNFGTPLTLIRS